jgi:hypothetical protein
MPTPFFDIEARFFSASTGLRLAVSPDDILAISWELTDAGGTSQITCSLARPFDDLSWTVQGGDTIEIWALGTGETAPRCRGQVGQYEKVLGLKEKYVLTSYGRMADMNHVLLDRVACIPGGADLSKFVAQIADDYAARRPSLSFVRDIEFVNVSLETLTQANATARAATDEIISQAAGNAVWGWDIDPATGLDRFYLRPKTAAVQAQFFVGATVTMLSSPREMQDMVNAIKIQGGAARYPNLLTNGGFEAPTVPTAQAGDLLTEGGFEDPGTWNYTGGATRNQADNTPGHQTPHTGQWQLLLDHPDEEAWQEIAAAVGQPYTATLFCARENGTYACTGRLVIEGRDGSGGSVLESYALPLAPPSTAWTGGEGSTVLAGDGLSLPFTFSDSSISIMRVRLIGDTVTDDHASGLLIDDVAVAPAGVAAQTGWIAYRHDTGDPENAFANLDWACGGAAWEGSYGVRADVKASGTLAGDFPQPFPEIDPFPGQDRGQKGNHFTPAPNQSLRALARVRMTPGLNSADGKAYITYNEWHSDGSGSQYGVAGFDIPNDGVWHLLSLDSSAHTDAASAMTTVGFALSGVYDVDGVECRDAAATAGMTDDALLDPMQAGFLRGSNFERYVTAEQLCAEGSDAANSYSIYGRQEAVVSNAQIVDWTPDAQSWAAAYLDRSAVPLDRPQVTLSHEPSQIPTPGAGSQVRVSGTAAADVQDWCGKATYTWGETRLGVVLELDSERPTWAKLLSSLSVGVSGSTSSVGASGAGAGLGGGTGTPAQAAIAITDGTTSLSGISTLSISGATVALDSGDTTDATADITITGGSGASPATATASGTVKTDVTATGPVVYLKASTDTLLAEKESSLGNPGTDGYLLSSTAAGVRSWVAPSGGGGGSGGGAAAFLLSANATLPSADMAVTLYVYLNTSSVSTYTVSPFGTDTIYDYASGFRVGGVYSVGPGASVQMINDGSSKWYVIP